MNADHTPGPWFYRRGDEWSHSVVTHHGSLPDGSMNCWEVASINKRREPEHEANARLIASAPDLLKELENCLDLLVTCFSEAPADSCIGVAITKARAAIKKATEGTP
jgi:hypothetical protein